MTHTRSVTSFYQGAGQRLVAVECYPPKIAQHLTAESDLVCRVIRAGDYTVAVEVGCMHGCLHFDALLRAGVKYLGIDLVPGSIESFQMELRSRYPNRDWPRAEVLDVCRLSSVAGAWGGEHVLVTFPFNSFGNLDRPLEAIAEVACCGFDLLILTYRTDAESTEARADYYGRCGYAHLRRSEDHRGIVFQAEEGLCSWAYREEWIAARLRDAGFDCETWQIGDIGIGYWGRRSTVPGFVGASK